MKRKRKVGTCAIGIAYANYQYFSNHAYFYHLGTIRGPSKKGTIMGVLCDICELLYFFQSMFMFSTF